MDKIKLGIIGAGSIGTVHLATLSQLQEDVVIEAITDVFLPAAKKRAQEYGVQRVIGSAEELINDREIDAVVIGVPNKFHAELAMKALQAGKHVIVEKPMGINGDAAKDIVRAQRESGKVLMVPHQMRWQANSLVVKKQVEDGALGNIYNAKTGWFRRKGIPGWGSWFTQMDVSGGGPLIDIGVHMLDLTLWLMGNPKPVSVFGSTYAEFGPNKKGIGTWGTPNWDGHYDVEDLATALIKMEDGSTLSLEVSWAVNMDTDNQPFVHLMGTDGGASIIGDSGKLLTEKFDQPVNVDLVLPQHIENERVALSKHFVECIREEKQPISSAMTGLTNNLIIDAIYESSKTGQVVTLDWNI